MDIVDETLSELRKAFDVESFRVRRLIVSQILVSLVLKVSYPLSTFYMLHISSLYLLSKAFQLKEGTERRIFHIKNYFI